MKGGEINMRRYYINRNAQANGDQEVHTTRCSHPPNTDNRVPLGNHATCRSAIQEARRRGFPRADGCAYCSPDCHSR